MVTGMHGQRQHHDVLAYTEVRGLQLAIVGEAFPTSAVRKASFSGHHEFQLLKVLGGQMAILHRLAVTRPSCHGPTKDANKALRGATPSDRT